MTNRGRDPGVTSRGDARDDPGARVTAPGGDGSGHPAAVPVLRDVEQHWPVSGRPRKAKGAIVVLRTDRVRMPDGELARRDVLEHPGAVAVVALDDAGQVLLIRQYRHPVGHLLWEIPAGLRDVPGEPLRGTGERELLEETGYAARTWHVLTDCYTSPGISTERVTVFLARDLAEVPGLRARPLAAARGGASAARLGAPGPGGAAIPGG